MALKHACIPNPGNRASFDLLSKSLTQPPTIHTPQGSPTRSNALTLTPTSKTVGTIRGSPFSKSSASKKGPKKFSDNIWDPDDDEFPDWPGTYKSTYGSFKSGSAKLSDLDSLPKGSGHERGHRLYSHPREGDLKTDDDSGGEIDTDARDAGPTRAELEIREQERIRDTIAELSDPACGKTSRADMHDELMVQHKFFRSQYEALPADLPAAHMHLVIWESFANLRRHDRIVQYVRPRLCDAVATVLFETSPKCLDDFLDGNVRVFEWRHEFSQSSRHLCLIVRREDNIVMVCSSISLCSLQIGTAFTSLIDTIVRPLPQPRLSLPLAVPPEIANSLLGQMVRVLGCLSRHYCSY